MSPRSIKTVREQDTSFDSRLIHGYCYSIRDLWILGSKMGIHVAT